MTPDKNQITDAEVKAYEDLMEKALNALSEHFDTVQIFCTHVHGPSETTGGLQRGRGNWFARRAQVEEWVRRNNFNEELQTEREFRSQHED